MKKYAIVCEINIQSFHISQVVFELVNTFTMAENVENWIMRYLDIIIWKLSQN